MSQGNQAGPPIGPQVIFGLDAEGICTISTGEGLADLGVRPDELVGQNLFGLYDESAQESLRRVLAGETFSVEREFDGRRLWIYLQPVRDSDGNTTGAIGVSTDVTEQRRLEAEARASRERARLLADVSAALSREVIDVEALLRVAARAAMEAVADVGSIWLRVPGTNRVEVRAVWTGEGDGPARLEGLATGTAAGEVPSFEVEPEAAGEPELVDLRDVHRRGTAEADLLRMGTERFGLTSLLRVPLRARGVLLGLLDVGRGPSRGGFGDDDISLVCDIGERCALALDNALLLAAERDAREELVKFRALADASDDFILIAAEAGEMTYVNPALRKAGVRPTGEVWSAVAAHGGEAVSTEIRHALETTGRWSGDVPASFDGRQLTVHGEIFRLLHPETGLLLGVAGIAQDVTEARVTEKALREAIAETRQFKALVDASPAFIAISGLDGKVMYVNPPGRAMIGMGDDVDAAQTVIADYLTPEGLEASLTVERPAVIANGQWKGESTLRNRQGPPIPVSITSFLIPDAETGEPFALATVQHDITDRLRAEAALRRLTEQREALLTRLVDAQDAERARIAADVHDDPVQALAAVEVQLGSFARLLREQAPELVGVVQPLQASVSGAMNRLRALLFDLEPPDLQHGLAPALQRAAEEIFGSADTRWTVEGADEEPDVPEATRAVAYRIAKEAMFNVQKHAGARHVVVTVGTTDGGLTVSVEDDGVGLGKGPVASSPGHRGLVTMQDRAAAAGGRCSIRNRPGGGTLVTAWLPGCARVAADAGRSGG